MVLLLHGVVMTNGIEQHAKLAEVASRLGSGVQLFFVLSGYVITGAMDRAYRSGDQASGFLLRRAAKLAPLYLVFLHANLAFFFLWSEASPDPHFFRNSTSISNVNVLNYVLHLGMLQGFFPGRVNTLLDGDWSIVCEAYFYLLMPLVLHRVTKTATGALWTLATSLIISVAFSLIFGKYLAGIGYFGYYALPVQLPCFLMGIFCWRVSEANLPVVPVPAQIAAGAVLALLFAGFARLEGAPLGGHIAISALFAVALLILRVPSGRGAFRALQWLGRQSYALFLIHLLILKVAYSTLFSNGFDPGFLPSLAINLTLSIGGSILLSWLLLDPIDRSIVHATGRWLSKRRKRRQSALRDQDAAGKPRANISA